MVPWVLKRQWVKMQLLRKHQIYKQIYDSTIEAAAYLPFFS